MFQSRNHTLKEMYILIYLSYIFLLAGIISNIGHFPYCEDKDFQKLLTIGPLTRYAEDLGLLMKVLTSTYDRNLRLDVPVDLRQLKVYYRFSMDEALGVLPVVPEIKNCVQKVVTHFTQYDIRAEEVFTTLVYTTCLFHRMCNLTQNYSICCSCQ